MDTDFKTRATVKMSAFTNMVEDTCSEPGCEMTILVEKDLKEQGRKSRCVACLMRSKLVRGEV
jgi:hypothetical protein